MIQLFNLFYFQPCPLLCAVDGGNPSIVKSILESKRNTTNDNKSYWHIVMIPEEANNEDANSSKGPTRPVPNRYKYEKLKDIHTPVALAISRDNADVLEVLRRYPMQPPEFLDRTPLHLACKYSSWKCFKLLMEAPDAVNMLHTPDKTYHGYRPLLPIHYAVDNNNVEMVKAMLDKEIRNRNYHRIYPGFKPSLGQKVHCPLQRAISAIYDFTNPDKYCLSTMVKLFLDAGVSYNFKQKRTALGVTYINAYILALALKDLYRPPFSSSFLSGEEMLADKVEIYCSRFLEVLHLLLDNMKEITNFAIEQQGCPINSLVDSFGDIIYSACQNSLSDFQRNASLIWSGKPLGFLNDVLVALYKCGFGRPQEGNVFESSSPLASFVYKLHFVRQHLHPEFVESAFDIFSNLILFGYRLYDTERFLSLAEVNITLYSHYLQLYLNSLHTKEQNDVKQNIQQFLHDRRENWGELYQIYEWSLLLQVSSLKSLARLTIVNSLGQDDILVNIEKLTLPRTIIQYIKVPL